MAKSEKDAEKVVRFLTKLRSNWGKRFENEAAEDAWLESMIEDLACYSEDVLNSAAATLRRSKLDFFPRIGQCIDACNQAKKDAEMQRPGFWTATIEKQRAGSNFDLAYDLLKTTPEGREAARNGYVLGYFWFVVREGRAPDATEKRRIIEGADEFDRLHPELLRGAMFPKPERGINAALDHKREQAIALENMCIKLATSMAERREQLRALALGENSSV
jgi:hypothetical protein